ncbi:hypothetical protein O0235_06565 [Tepidiforma flava]|uniref:Uncharacterized protein n=1 Tax=Tepidiforma flava TaxID=3004094 RepID=A0ABY7MCJ7_9CHLR|nr:hypothetical protein [Tepidiforma flava]WBL37226.1 hypothetical protein O0235_06565 [Tepidiforma flava]
MRASARNGVDFEDAVQLAQVDADDGAAAGRGFDAADDRGAAAVGNSRRAGFAAPFEDGRNLRFVAGEGNDVGRVGEVAAEGADDVAEALAVVVGRALMGIGRADGSEGRRRLDAGRPEADLFDARHRRRLDADAVAGGKAGGGLPALVVGRLFGFEAPGPEAAASGHASPPRG